MGVTGHPDWLRTPVGIANVFVNKNLTLNTNGTILGTFYTSDYTSIAITLFDGDATAYNWLELRWDTVNSPLVWSSRDIIAIGPHNTGTFTVPVKGTWVQLVAFADVAPTGLTSVLVYGTTSTITPDMDRGNGDTLIEDSSAYGAAASKTFDAVSTYAGPVVFSAYSDVGNQAHAEVRMYSAALKLHVVYMDIGIPKLGSNTPVVLYSPPRHMRIVVTNNGAAQNIFIAACPAPLFGS